MRKQGIPVYGHYKMFKNRNYNNASQKRLAKFALIKYHINFRNYGTCMQHCSLYSIILSHFISWELLDLHKSKQGNTTNLNISFSMENEKKSCSGGLKPTTYCLRGRCSIDQLSYRGSSVDWAESRQYNLT